MVIDELFYSVSDYNPEQEYVFYISFQTSCFSALWLRILVSILFMKILAQATVIFTVMLYHVFEGSFFCIKLEWVFLKN